MHKNICVCRCHFCAHGCAIDLQILFVVKHKKIVFNMKSTNVGMSLINVWSVVFIMRNERHASTPSECGMLVYR